MAICASVRALRADSLAAVVTAYASVLFAIKIAGALYLLWLAFNAFRSAAQSVEPVARKIDNAKSVRAYFNRGMIIQMTNPKGALAWIGTMSLGLQADAPLWVGLAIVVGTFLISVLGYQIYALVFSTAPMIAAYRRTRRWVQAGLGTFFCFASYQLLMTKT